MDAQEWLMNARAFDYDSYSDSYGPFQGGAPSLDGDLGAR